MNILSDIPQLASPVDAALSWAKRGRFVIPVKWGTKDGVPTGWPDLRITPDTAREYFTGKPTNIAVLPGPSGLADVDLDCDEAVRAAPHLLPATYTYGRERRPGSHMLFACAATKTRKWRDPMAQASKAMLVELRSEGAYSIIPPSVHPDGDQYRRESKHAAAQTTPEALAAGCARVAAAALVARYWPAGSRHDAALALAGSLLHGGMDAADVLVFCQAVVEAAADDELADRMRAVQDTIRDFQAGKAITGWPTLAGHLPAEVIARLREWLDIEDFPALESGAPQPTKPALVTAHMASVIEQPLDPLWPGLLYAGKITLLCGDPKKGKSLVTLDIAARVSTGTPWPCSAERREPGNVLLLSAEDDDADTVKPRLVAAEADCKRIYSVHGLAGEDGRITALSLDRHWREISDGILEFRPRLIVIDPLSAYMGRADSHNEGDVRTVLRGLATLAGQSRAAVLAVRHFRKSTGDTALGRVIGSIAFSAAARANWGVVTDPEDEERRLLLDFGGNLARDTGGYAFRVAETAAAVPYIAWDSERELRTVEELLGIGDGRVATCESCGEPFVPGRSGAKFCSAACRQKAYRERVTDTPASNNRNSVTPPRNNRNAVTEVTENRYGVTDKTHRGIRNAGDREQTQLDTVTENAGARNAAQATLLPTQDQYPCLNCGGKGCRICDPQVREKQRGAR